MSMVTCMTAFSLAACGSDNNDPTTPIEEKATSVTISPVVYVTVRN